MTDYPISPPPELVQQWHDAWIDAKVKHDGLVDFIATHAARWGADKELETCCEWLEQNCGRWDLPLHTARRPKPPSLKEQALAALNEMEDKMFGSTVGEKLIRRALEALPDEQ